jgi:hypothetical protein
VSIPPPEQPRASRVAFIHGELVVHLEDGREVVLPLRWFPKLRDASPEARAEWHLIGNGIGIRWPRLDEDLSVRALLAPKHVSRRRQDV